MNRPLAKVKAYLVEQYPNTVKAILDVTNLKEVKAAVDAALEA